MTPLAARHERESKIDTGGVAMSPDSSCLYETFVVTEALICKSSVETQHHKFTLAKDTLTSVTTVEWRLKY